MSESRPSLSVLPGQGWLSASWASKEARMLTTLVWRGAAAGTLKIPREHILNDKPIFREILGTF